MSYIAAAIGIPAGLFFIFGINEVKLSRIANSKLTLLVNNTVESPTAYNRFGQTDQQEEGFGENQWSNWFKMPLFYVCGLCYMGVRLYCNLFGTLLPFYLVDVLELGTP